MRVSGGYGLLQRLEASGLYGLAYADDGVVMKTGKNIGVVSECMQMVTKQNTYFSYIEET